MSGMQTESRKALHELIDLVREIEERWASPEWNLNTPDDVVAAHCAMMHMLEGGLATFFEDDPDHPQFRRIVSPIRKFTGDNSDAIYFDAPVSPEYEYVVRGTLNGAAYFSLTIELNSGEGIMSTDAGGTLTNADLEIDEAR